MRRLAPLLLLSACTWVDQGDWERANDRDGDGFLAEVNGGDDCDDSDPTVHPGADELCNGADDDCDGDVDEDPTELWYVDGDSDGFGDDESATAACDTPQGMVPDGGDCDDGDPAVHPEADELCNGADDDCDGDVDEDVVDPEPWYVDGDGDGYGVPDDPIEACDPPDGYAPTDDDCDDTDPATHPDATEVLDGQDQDCDGVVDELEAASAATWSLYGQEGYDQVGQGAQGRGDYNGDGDPDLTVAVPGLQGDEGRGAVALWWGDALVLTGQQTTADWAPDALVYGGLNAERTTMLSGATSLDGEAATLVLSNQASDATTCHLFFADTLADGAELDLDAADVELEDCGADEPGQLRAGGDLNGDGYADLPLLTRDSDSLWLLAGRASNHWNPVDGKSATSQAELEFTDVGPSDELVVLLEADLDGDGLDDLLVGSPDAEDAYGGNGTVQLLYGDEAWLDWTTSLVLSDAADASIIGSFAGQHLGRVIAAGDLDADGHPELLMGTPAYALGAVWIVPGSGTRIAGPHVLDGFSPYHWSSSDSPADAGQSLSTGVDVDGDALPDVLVASVEGEGRAWLVSGSDALAGLDLDEDAAVLLGLGAPEGSGLTADLDGDGSGELLLVDPTDGSYAVRSGVLHLLPGYR
jgi:hypothetical protein